MGPGALSVCGPGTLGEEAWSLLVPENKVFLAPTWALVSPVLGLEEGTQCPEQSTLTPISGPLTSLFSCPYSHLVTKFRSPLKLSLSPS